MTFTMKGPYDEIVLPTYSGRYEDGELAVVRTMSEDGLHVYEFTDRKGRKVVTRTDFCTWVL